MSIIALIVILAALAGLYWLFNYKWTVAQPIKFLINLVIIVTAVILVLSAFGIWDEVKAIKVPHI